MPYIIRKHNGKHKVYKRGDGGQPVGKPLGKHRTRSSAVDQLRALYANDEAAGKEKGVVYAIPEQQKLKIHDRKHIGLAIAALHGDSKAPHGHGVDLSPDDRKRAINAIRKRIPKVANDKDDEAELRARLAVHDTKEYDEWFEDDYSEKDWANYAAPPAMNPTFPIKLDPDDSRVAFDPLGGDAAHACANCFWWHAQDNSCELVAGPIPATGISNLWLQQEPDEPSGSDDYGDQAMSILGPPNEPYAKEAAFGFKMFGENNEYWAAFFTNNAKDRDGEWFAQKAHDRVIERLDAGELPMPQLDFWHTKAFHGQAFLIAREGHVVFAVGKFADTPFAESMKEYYASVDPDDLRVSFGYFFPRWALVKSVYHDYAPFEISPLPAKAAANLWTGFSMKEWKDMTVPKWKRKQLAQVLGPERASQLLREAGEKSRALDTIETDFKEHDGSDLESDIRAIKKALKQLRLKEDVSSFGSTQADKPPKVPTKHQGQPRNQSEADDHVDEDLDDEDEENIGALDKEMRLLEKQVALLKMRKKLHHLKAKAQSDGDGEDDGDDDEDDGEDDGASDDGGKARRRKKSVSPERGLKELASGFKAISDSIAAMDKAVKTISQNQQTLAGQINGLAQEIYNPTSAQRSPYTVIPQGDPAADALAMKMAGAGSGEEAPGAPTVVEANDLAQFLGLPTAFGRNGRN